MNYRFIGLEPNYVGPTRVQILTHEVGHWLGLFHVFNKFECFLAQGNGRIPECDLYGDLICDTPIMESYSTHYFDDTTFEPLIEIAGYNLVKGCLGNTISSENFMDYGEELSFFTEQQVQRMHEKTAFYRRDIYNETYLNSGCSIDNGFVDGSGGGGGTRCNNYAEIVEDYWGFRLKGVTDFSADNGNLVVLVDNTGNRSLNFYKINECDIVKEHSLDFTVDHLPIENVYLKNNFLFLSRGYRGGGNVKIYKKRTDGSWGLKQTLTGDYGIGKKIIFKDNILLLSENKKVIVYNYNGNTFSGRYILNHDANQTIE